MFKNLKFKTFMPLEIKSTKYKLYGSYKMSFFFNLQIIGPMTLKIHQLWSKSPVT